MMWASECVNAREALAISLLVVCGIMWLILLMGWIATRMQRKTGKEDKT